jgi:hypothetical protein
MTCRTWVGRLFCLSYFSKEENLTGPNGVIMSVLSNAARMLCGLKESARRNASAATKTAEYASAA